MGRFTKWLGAGLGFTFGGPIGALVGLAVGSIIDGFSIEEFVAEQKNLRQSQGANRVNSGDFKISLLILAAAVIKSDGKVDSRELDFVREHFVAMYGKERSNKAFKLFKGVLKENISLLKVCTQIRQAMPHPSRLQLLHFLFSIAKADGSVSESEVNIIKTIANYLYISSGDFESIKAMFYQALDNSYKILGLSQQAAEGDIKKAYRKMAKKYHPDRLAGTGAAHIQGAKEKFQKIQQAYQQIKKERGFV